MQHLKYILIFSFVCLTSLNAQEIEILKTSKAVEIALENNYGIKIANNNVEISKNNSSIYNSGYLPKATISSGFNFANNDTEFTLQDGSKSKINGAESKSLNASVGLSYTLFDGMGRSYNYKKLKESYNLSELEAQTVIENSLLQIFNVYYEVGRLTEDNSNINESLVISKQRLKRAQYSFEYGQNTKLQVLNAEVDVNNDSIRFINSKRQLANSKRDLNLLLGRSVTTIFNVDTNIKFDLSFDYENTLSKAKSHNVEIQKANKNLELSKLDVKINQSSLFPKLSLNGSYGFNKSDNDATFNYAEQLSNGINAGVSLSWNIFDGGTTKTRVQNAKIFSDNVTIQKEQILNELERNVANGLETFNNSLFVLSSEEKNVETNKRNFERSEEQFKLGQITTIEFRQAQVNLLNAQSNLNQAKYAAKNAELKLLQLTGELLNSKF